jgi:DNA-binding NtrC family response regulator
MTELILLVSGNEDARPELDGALKALGYRVNTATNAAAVNRAMAESEPDLLLLDDPWPSGVSKAMVEKWATAHPVLMLLGQDVGDQDALHALRLGVAEFLVKPVATAELDAAIRRIIDHAMLFRTGEFYTNVVRLEAPSLLVGESQPLRRLLDELRAVAAYDSTVLILGESGVGKEKVAQEIHRLSERAAGPLMAVDCCSLQESLFESELFGHERGAFTGAAQRKPGLIEQARGGTLFLDEIGEIPPPIQAKLLRVLETRRFRRVGGTEDLAAEVRIVAATNRNLDAMVANGEFREDLLYRLNAFVVSVPPLRDRREDILPLAQHFLANSGFSRRVVKRMSEAVQQSLQAYDWPGNVRELRNVMERAVILSGHKLKIDLEHLTLPKLDGPVKSASVVELTFDHEPTLAEIEQHYVDLLLERYQGRRAAIARILGIGERTLYRLLANTHSK